MPSLNYHRYTRNIRPISALCTPITGRTRPAAPAHNLCATCAETSTGAARSPCDCRGSWCRGGRGRQASWPSHHRSGGGERGGQRGKRPTSRNCTQAWVRKHGTLASRKKEAWAGWPKILAVSHSLSVFQHPFPHPTKVHNFFVPDCGGTKRPLGRRGWVGTSRPAFRLVLLGLFGAPAASPNLLVVVVVVERWEDDRRVRVGCRDEYLPGPLPDPTPLGNSASVRARDAT